MKHVTIPFTKPEPETRGWSVSKLTIEINRLHNEIANSLHSSLDKAIQAGELLVNLKEQLGRGNFTSHISARLRCSTRTASRYMALYQRQGELVGLTGIKEAQHKLEGQDGPEGNLKRLRRDLVRPLTRVRHKLDQLRHGALVEHQENMESIRAEISEEIDILRNRYLTKCK